MRCSWASLVVCTKFPLKQVPEKCSLLATHLISPSIKAVLSDFSAFTPVKSLEANIQAERYWSWYDWSYFCKSF